MKSDYDYIILGAGASGLMLAYRMSQDAFYDSKSVLIIDKIADKGNDRTYCFWENGAGEWDEFLTKNWTTIFFGSNSFSKSISITPFNYKMIRSETFYNALWKGIGEKSNFTFVEDVVDSFSELHNGVQVITENTRYSCSKLFNSLLDSEVYKSQNKYPLIHQHFVGWFVRTETDMFDDSKATFMDFTVPQNGNTRFMYVLPLDKKTALFEYTLFSKKTLEYSEYENAIKDYLNKNNISNYSIVEKEKGNIPMTSFKFNHLNSEHILNIGTAGGWTKASTGYTFKNTSKKTKEIIRFLKNESDFTKFYKKTKYRFYDLIFLDVLANHNAEGSALFHPCLKRQIFKLFLNFRRRINTARRFKNNTFGTTKAIYSSIFKTTFLE